MVYRGYLLHSSEDLSIVRIGFVSDNEVKFLIREPDQAALPLSIKICVEDADSEDCTNSPEVMETTVETDFTSIIVAKFWHDEQKTYGWTSSNGHRGTVTAAPRPGAMPANGNFTFLSTSCIVNHFPYNPLDSALSIPGLRRLHALLPHLEAQFMLFLGDFIYIDVPHRFGRGSDAYRRKYRQAYASHDMTPVMKDLSWIHVIDDHEIANDWDSGKEGVYEAAMDAYMSYHVAGNPPAAPKAGDAAAARGGLTYFSFTQGPASFFLLDTRSFRSRNDDEDGESKTMLGAEQLEDFIAWLARPEVEGVRWKIVASSIPFTKNWPINRRDTWGGFMTERRKVLEAMWEAAGNGYGVIVLSGDRHEFAATAFPPPENSTYTDEHTVYEFSTSPLNQFASAIGTYQQIDDDDVMLKYLPRGTSKVAAITISKEGEDNKSQLLFRVFIDGVMAWNTTIVAPSPVGLGGGGDGQNKSGIWHKLSTYFS